MAFENVNTSFHLMYSVSSDTRCVWINVLLLSGGKGGKKKKNKNSSKPQKNNGSTWANVPLPPPPVQPLPGTEMEHYAVEQQENG